MNGRPGAGRAPSSDAWDSLAPEFVGPSPTWMEPARSDDQVLRRLCSTTVGRLGWTYRDLGGAAIARPETAPAEVVIDPRLQRASRMARARLQDLPAMSAIGLMVGASFGVTVGLGGVDAGIGAEVARGVLAFLPFAAGTAGWGAYVAVEQRRQHVRMLEAERVAARVVEEDRRTADADQRRWAEGERRRRDQTPEWLPILAGRQLRLDIMGGSLRSWCGLLTTFLTSTAQPGRQVIALDLTGRGIMDEAASLLDMARRKVRTVALDRSTAERLTRGLDRDRLTDLLIDLVHGAGNVEKSEERTLDTRILQTLCTALGTDLSGSRVHEALRELLGEPRITYLLTDDELNHVMTLFSGDFVQHVNQRLRVLEAYTGQLVPDMDAEAAPAEQADTPADELDADLLCLGLRRHSRAAGDLLVNLAVQWAGSRVDDGDVRTVVVAGADRVPLLVLEHLARCCEQREVQLVVLFEHLRDEAIRFVGGGQSVGVMRLGNHLEAEAAANFIGRAHTFVLSSVTRGYGGQSGRSAGTQQGGSVQDSTHAGYGYQFGRLLHTSSHTGGGRSYGTNWGESQQLTEGTNWSLSETTQRVYEYQVEPTQLQALPEYALLLVTPRQGGTDLTSVECSPDIATLSRVSPTPAELGPGVG